MLTLIDRIKRHEGFNGQPYLDSVGVLTIGYGRNLIANPLTEDEATYLLVQDLERHRRDLERAVPWIVRLDDVRHEALLNMAYNLGVPRLLGFRRMWRHMERGEYAMAAEEALDSLWARQVGRRALDVASALETGEWERDG